MERAAGRRCLFGSEIVRAHERLSDFGPAALELAQVMDEALVSHVINRLEADDSLAPEVSELVLAALLGEVEECLGGRVPKKPAPAALQDTTPGQAYVNAIAVEGFRGIGPQIKLVLPSGPGLTLIVGRNGSGKSSFAEALELLLTGENQRWSARRSQIWKEGWRNLHHHEATEIQADLLIDGEPGPLTLKASWQADQSMDQGRTEFFCMGTSDKKDLGWKQPLATYRPFLSYNELGSMLEEGPSKLFDALASILGLEDLVRAAGSLGDAKKRRTDAHKETTKKGAEIRAALEVIDDERAVKSIEALDAKPWQLADIEAVVAGGSLDTENESEIEILRQLAHVKGPDPQEVSSAAEGILAALEAVQSLAGTDADRSRRTADILAGALELHQHHGDGDCPVCGRADALEPSWSERAETEIQRLRDDAKAAEQAHRNLRGAELKVRNLTQAPPPALSRASEAGIDAHLLLDVWHAFVASTELSGEKLALEVERRSAELEDAARAVRQQADTVLKEKEDAWRPAAARLAEWLPLARELIDEADTIDHLKKAEKWIRQTATDIRNDRFQPIKEKVKHFWELLRTHSNVDLYDVSFEGAASRRRVKLGVRVDGTEGAALGVMSQGELHSLALSLFLPRATLDASPFRFLFIDDPVQAMDPAKVDGLARVLHDVARDRQVVVFTHDDRLPQAVRYLGIEATIIEVQRREGSVVELRTAQSPIDHYISDALALMKTTELPPHVTQRVVPGLCRQSIEAACIEVIRRRRLTRGIPHVEVEELIGANRKLFPRLALALFDDAQRTSDVMRTLNNKFGSWSGDIAMACNKGAHQAVQADGLTFVRNSKRLAVRLLELK